MHDISIVGDEGFEHMINDLVFQVYECGRCLGFGHNKESCTIEFRCRAFLFYGHKEKNCLNKKGKSSVWHPKATRQKEAYNPKSSNPSPAVLSPLSLASDTLVSSPPPIPSPDHSSAPSVAPMAAFELDPARWVPMGHHLVDGGPTRLPRMFYTPYEDSPARYGNYVVAILERAPLQVDEAVWRELVRDFIVQHHQRAVVSFQRALFGLGLYELRSAAAVSSLLYQQRFEIAHGVFVHFVCHNDRLNHRSAHGFRSG
jgi:hypothetical protein